MATLNEFWEGESALYGAKVTSLVTTTQSLQAELKHLGDTDLAGALAEFSARSQEIAELRRELAAATVPANASALIEEMRGKLIEQREAQVRALEAKTQIAEKRARLTVQQAALERAQADLARAEQSLAEAESAAALRDAAKAALTVPPLDTLATDAAAAKTGPAQTAAKARIDAMPAELVALSERAFGVQSDRFGFLREAVATAEASLATLGAATAGREGELFASALAFRNAEAALLRSSASGADDLARALALLERVAAEPVLSAAEAADTAADGDGIAAATSAVAVIDAQETFDAAAAAFEDAWLEASLVDPDATPSGSDLDTKRTAFENAEADLGAQKAGFSQRDALHALTVIAPDGAWSRVRDYFQALAVLDFLAATPSTLASGADTAETAYASALENYAKARRARDLVEDTLSERVQKLQALLALETEHLQSSVRGDTA